MRRRSATKETRVVTPQPYDLTTHSLSKPPPPLSVRVKWSSWVLDKQLSNQLDREKSFKRPVCQWTLHLHDDTPFSLIHNPIEACFRHGIMQFKRQLQLFILQFRIARYKVKIALYKLAIKLFFLTIASLYISSLYCKFILSNSDFITPNCLV